MAQPYPLPRETRETAVMAGTGTDTYGPFAFKVFDTADVAVYWKKSTMTAFAAVSCTVTKTVPADALSTFSVVFPESIDATTSYVVRAERVHERSDDVTRGGTIDPPKLEKELSKQASVLQELRRDYDRTFKAEIGETGGRVFEGAEATVPKWDADGNLIEGPSVPEIENAEAHAAAAKEWAVNAEDTAVSEAAGGNGATTFSSLHWAAKASGSASAAALNVTYSAQWAMRAVDDLIPAAAGGDEVSDYSARHWASKSQDFAALAGSVASPFSFKTLALALADTVLSYTAGAGKVLVAAGFLVGAGVFTYEVAASGASDHQLVTAEGVKLYARNIGGMVNAEQWGFLEAANSTARAAVLQACFDYAEANNIGSIMLPPGSHALAAQIDVVRTSGRPSIDLVGPGTQACTLVSEVVGDVTGDATAGFLFRLDGIRHSHWRGFTIDYSVAGDATTAGRGGIVTQCLSESFFANDFSNIRFVGGAASTDRETDNRRSYKGIGNQAEADSTGFVNYFNHIHDCSFNIAYTHIEAVKGDGNPGTAECNGLFVGAGCVFERYIIAVQFNDNDECEVFGDGIFFQQAAGVGGINGGYTDCVAFDGSFIRLNFIAEPGSNSRPFAAGANATHVNCPIAQNTTHNASIDPANTGRFFYQNADRMDGVTRLNSLIARDIDIFGTGTAAHSGGTAYTLRLWRKSSSTDKLRVGFDNATNRAVIEATGKDLDLRPTTTNAIILNQTYDKPVRFGTFYLWFDNSGLPRWKASAPASATDGTLMGNANSDGTTGGTGSAGAGNQYVELEINGTTYKVLHDGTV